MINSLVLSLCWKTPASSFRTATKVCALLIYLSLNAADTDYPIVRLGTPTHSHTLTSRYR